MINFLDPALNPKVTCDKNCTDDYEPENLISRNFVKKSRGFLAYTTVKPPVDLDFEFICPISIDHIAINSTVGSHKNSGIEILAKFNKTYISVGKSVYNASGIVFCSSRQYTHKTLPPNIALKKYHIAFLKEIGFVLHNVKFIKIRIFRTDRFVPCLGSVEIWGAVSNQCSDVTKRTIQTLFEKSLGYAGVATLEQSPDGISYKNSQLIKEIPDDFKDDLTFEIMTIPVTLPSGKTIDQSTLDKHVESEKAFGRKAGDPFTGLKFTDTSKPVLNVALKSRIDMYSLQHSLEPQGHSLGHGSKRTSEQVCEIKTIQLENDEISIDASKLNYKQFHTETVQCFICKIKQCLYILPCKHLYCRKCLNELCYNMKCKQCCKDFSRTLVERYHF